MPQIAAAICRPFCRLWRLFCLYSISVPMHRSLSLSFSSVRLNCSLCPVLIDPLTPARFHTKRRTLKADPRRLTSSRPFSSHLAIHHRFSRVVASDLSTCIISIFCLISDECNSVLQILRIAKQFLKCQARGLKLMKTRYL